MKNILLILLLFISFVCLNSQVLKIDTPDGTFKMSVSEDNSNAKIKSKKEPVVDKIADKLDLLQKKYCSKLNRLDQKRVKKIMDEIYDLLADLPDDVYTTSHNQSQSQNININLTTSDNIQTPQKTVEKDITPVSSKAMSESDFQTLYNNVKNESFASDKLSVIKIAAKRNKFTVSQLTRLLDLFSFEEDKITCLQIVYPKLTDKKNAHQILNHFEYSSDKEKVEQIINQ